MKFVIGLLLLFPSLGLAQDASLTVILYKQQSYVYPNRAIGGVSFNENIVKVDILNNQAVITALQPSGKQIIVQIFREDGKIINLIVENPKNVNPPGNFNIVRVRRGHSVYLRTYYGENYVTGGSSLNNYGAFLQLQTRVGTNGDFYSKFSYQKDRPISYFLKHKYKDVFVAYGDNSILFNEYKPSILDTPQLRQAIVGYEGDTFELDFWAGRYNPLAYNDGRALGDIIIASKPNEVSYENTFSDWFYGARTSYLFGESKKHAIFASYWNNPNSENPIPYVGARFSLFDRSTTWRTSFGGNSDRPVISNSLNYQKNGLIKDWTMQRAYFNHTIAKNGYDQLLFFTELPFEEVDVGFEFYSINKEGDKGSIVLKPGYAHLVNGFSESDSFGGEASWESKKVKVGVYGNYAIRQSSTSSEQEYITQFSPFLKLLLKEYSDRTYYWLDVEQSQYKSEFEFTENEFIRNQTKFTLRRQTPNTTMGLGVGRFSDERSNGKTSDGYRISPFASYRKDKIKLRAGLDLSFNNSNDPIVEDESYRLGYQKAYAQASYAFNYNHEVSTNFNQYLTKTSEFDRKYYNWLVSYTYRTGSNTKPITDIFKGANVVVKIFKDLNDNKKYDKGEPTFKGVKIIARNGYHIEEGVSDDDGDLSIGGLDAKSYDLQADYSVLPEGAVLAGLPSQVDIAKNSKQYFNVLVNENKKIKVLIKSKSKIPDYLTLRIVCNNKVESIRSVQSSAVNNFDMPINKDCFLELDIASLKGDLSVEENNLPVHKDQDTYEFKLNSEKLLVGKIYLDKNSNRISEDDELLNNVTVNFNQGSVLSRDGYFSFKVKDANSLKYLNTSKYRCRPQEKDKTYQNSLRINLICQKQ